MLLSLKKQKKKCSINLEFDPNLVKADLKFTFDIIRPIGSTELLEAFSSEKCLNQCNSTYLAQRNVIDNSDLSSSSAGWDPFVWVSQGDSRSRGLGYALPGRAAVCGSSVRETLER